jgi:hypothetical protein
VSTFCIDDVCCDTPCNRLLDRCNLPSQVGTCESTAAPAPAMTRTGLLAAAALLFGIAALALRPRLRRA